MQLLSPDVSVDEDNDEKSTRSAVNYIARTPPETVIYSNFIKEKMSEIFKFIQNKLLNSKKKLYI